MQLQGSHIIVRALIEQGVDVVFGFPGANVIDIYDALYAYGDDVRHVLVAHEQGAAHAADGYARATGRVGVCLGTSGPGAMNLVTGIATAFLDSVPMVAITGNVAASQIGTDSFQEIDITGVTLPITKHNFFVDDVDELAATIREAFRLARSGRPGPVLVDIAKDVQQASAPYEPEPPVTPDPPAPIDPATLMDAAACINACHRPLVYFGGGIVAAGAEQELLALADKVDAPIACSLMGISTVASDHPRFLGMEGMHGHYAATTAMKNADCIIALGCRFSDRSTGDRTRFAVGTHIVHVDIDGSEISKTTQDTFGIMADVKVALQALLPLIEQADHRGWRALLRDMRAAEAAQADVRAGMTPAAIMRLADARRDRLAPVVTDVGQHQMWAAQHLTFDHGRSFITSGGLGTMGFGIPAAIGASIATRRRTLLVVGDGGFGMSLHELATAVSQAAPITILLMNNGVLGMVRQWQHLFYGKRYASTTLKGYRHTDHVALARAMGAEACAARTLEELGAAFEQAQEATGPFLIECAIDADEFVLPMLPPGGALEDIIVEVGE